MSEKHNNVKNILTKLLNEVCLDVESEPHLIPDTKEAFSLRSVNTSEEARLLQPRDSGKKDKKPSSTCG